MLLLLLFVIVLYPDQEMKPKCRLEEASVPCSSKTQQNNCSVRVTRCEDHDDDVEDDHHDDQDELDGENDHTKAFLPPRCELVSANVTRLRPTTSCSRDPVMTICHNHHYCREDHHQ